MNFRLWTSALLAVAASVLLAKYVRQWYDKLVRSSGLRGYAPFPVFGFNVFRFARLRANVHRAMDEDAAANGLYSSAWIFYEMFVVVCRPELIKQIVAAPASWAKYDRARNELEPLDVLLGQRGLLLERNGARWQSRRMLFAPAFSRLAMKRTTAMVQARTALLLSQVCAESSRVERCARHASSLPLLTRRLRLAGQLHRLADNEFVDSELRFSFVRCTPRLFDRSFVGASRDAASAREVSRADV